MGTSFIGEVSSDRLTSCPGHGENHLSAKRHGNRSLAPTLWALWPKKTNFFYTIQFVGTTQLVASIDLQTLTVTIYKLKWSKFKLKIFSITISHFTFPQREINYFV